MAQPWSFGRKLAAGFGIALAFTGVNGLMSVQAMREVVAAKDAVIDHEAGALVDAAELDAAIELQVGALGGYLLTRESRYVDTSLQAQSQALELLRQLRAHSPEAQSDLDAMETAYHEYARVAHELIDMRTNGAPVETVEQAFTQRARPKREALKRTREAFVQRQTAALEGAKQEASEKAVSTSRWVSLIAILAGIFSALTAVILSRGDRARAQATSMT